MRDLELLNALAEAYRDRDNAAMDGVLAEIDEKSKAEEAEKSRYEAMSIPELKRLSDGGDDKACAAYCEKRIDEDTLDPDDVWRMFDGVKRMNYDCALLSAMIYGIKGGGYEDRSREIYCLSVMEQFNDKDAYKRLTKAYKHESDEIDDAAEGILSTVLGLACATAMGSKYTSCAIKIVSADKFDKYNFCDFKRAHKVFATFYGDGLRPYDFGQIYTFYSRGKDRHADVERLCSTLVRFFDAISEKSGFTRVECEVDGAPRILYGGGKIAKERPNVRVTKQSDFDLNVSVAEKEAVKQFDSLVCPFCGGAVENGVCTACKRAVSDGRLKATDGGANISIEKSAASLTALICTRCGAPISRDKDGHTGVCSACGTTYIIDNDALKSERLGLDLKSIKAAMPENAALPDVKFMRAAVVNDSISMVLPDDFIPMPDEIVRIKYPANAPEYMYSTPDWRINLGFREGPPLADCDVPEFAANMLGVLKKMQPQNKYNEPQVFNGDHTVYFFDFISRAGADAFYNAMFVFSRNGKQVMGSWNCFAQDRWFWAPVFKLAVGTMKFQ